MLGTVGVVWPAHADGTFHVTDHRIEPCERFVTLCGLRLTTTAEDYPVLGGKPSGGACEDCATVLRQMYQLPKAAA